MQRRLPVVVGGFDVGSGVEQELDAIEMSLLGGKVKRGLFKLAPGVDVSPAVDEALQTLEMSMLGSKMDWSKFVEILGVNI